MADFIHLRLPDRCPARLFLFRLAMSRKPTRGIYRHRVDYYLYAKGDHVIHDKTCPEARKIRDEDLRYSEGYPNHLHPCPHCRTKAYLRLGARDLHNLRGYEALFEEMGISPQLQRRLYVHEGIRTEYLGPGRLKLWGKEDSWILETIPESTRLRLLHNNYRPPRMWERFVLWLKRLFQR